MNLFKRIKHYYEYKKLVKKSKQDLYNDFNIRVDNIYRLYTVLNVPDETQIYGKENADKLTETWIKSWLVRLDTFLVNKHIREFVIRQELTKIDDQNYLIVFRYKYLNIEKILYVLYLLGIITFITILTLTFIKIF